MKTFAMIRQPCGCRRTESTRCGQRALLLGPRAVAWTLRGNRAASLIDAGEGDGADLLEARIIEKVRACDKPDGFSRLVCIIV